MLFDDLLLEFYLAINKAREDNHVSKVDINLNLEDAAKRHCDDMFFNNFCSHIGSDKSNYITRARACGFKGFPSGEIIVKGPGGKNKINAVINGWLGSSGHRKILLDSLNLRMGAAYRLRTETINGNYWVAIFSH